MAGWDSGTRYVGLGIELVAAIVGMALVGYWVDHHFGTAPWGMLAALMVGLIGGMYNFLRLALRAAHGTPPAGGEGRAADDPAPGGGGPRGDGR
jgi:F0F1-type ATP synthase assembly protein I